LLDSSTTPPSARTYDVGKPDRPRPLDEIFDELITIIAERNPDFYECVDGSLVRASG
jgi:hypothetical protein